MSKLTKLARSNPISSAVLDDVEAGETALAPASGILVQHVGAAIQATTNAVLTKSLGSGAEIAEPVVDSLLAEFESWLSSKL